MPIQQGTASQGLKVFMEDPDNPGVGVEGLESVLTIKILKEGAARAVTPQGAIRALPGIPGAYEAVANADDADTQGEIMVYASAPGALNDIQAYEVGPNTSDEDGDGVSTETAGWA